MHQNVNDHRNLANLLRKPYVLLLLLLCAVSYSVAQSEDISYDFETLDCEQYIGRPVADLLAEIPVEYDEVSILFSHTGVIGRVTFEYTDFDIRIKTGVREFKYVKDVYLLAESSELDIAAYSKEILTLILVDKGIGRRNRLCEANDKDN